MKTNAVRILRLVAALSAGGAAATPAQLAITQPTTKLLILPLVVKSPADSAVSIAAMDAARERLATMARYKVAVIPKAKLCDALKASDFSCDVLLDEAQARLLARFAFAFTMTNGNPGTPAALGETIAVRLNTIVRAGENARECNDKRQKGQLNSALDAARKALSIEPNLTAAHLCVATVYEAERMPPDSMIADTRPELPGQR